MEFQELFLKGHLKSASLLFDEVCYANLTHNSSTLRKASFPRVPALCYRFLRFGQALDRLVTVS